MDEYPTRTLGEQAAAEGGARLEPASGAVNELAELVADLLEPTELVPADRLAALRGQVGGGSLAQSLLDHGLADSVGLARALAERHRLPFIEILGRELPPQALSPLSLDALRRVGAIPYAFDGTRLSIAVSDPSDVAAIDELRLAAGGLQV